MKRLILTIVAALNLAGTGHAFTNQAAHTHFNHDTTQANGASGPRAECTVAVSIDDPLNVRTQPNGTIVAVLPNGTRVGIYDRKGKWVFVQDFSEDSGRSGWVYAQYLNGCHPVEDGC